MTAHPNTAFLNKIVFHNTLQNDFPNEDLAKLHISYDIAHNNIIYYIDDCNKTVPLVICQNLENNKYQLSYVTGEIHSCYFENIDKAVKYCKDYAKRYLCEISNLNEKHLITLIRLLTNKPHLTIKISAIDSVNIQEINGLNALILTSATNEWRFYIDKSLNDLAVQFIELMNNYMNY